MAPESDDIALSELQLDVMRVLWRGDASVADVAAALADSRGLAHTTVATVLTRLAKRGDRREAVHGHQQVELGEDAFQDVSDAVDTADRKAVRVGATNSNRARAHRQRLGGVGARSNP